MSRNNKLPGRNDPQAQYVIIGAVIQFLTVDLHLENWCCGAINDHDPEFVNTLTARQLDTDHRNKFRLTTFFSGLLFQVSIPLDLLHVPASLPRHHSSNNRKEAT